MNWSEWRDGAGSETPEHLDQPYPFGAQNDAPYIWHFFSGEWIKSPNAEPELRLKGRRQWRKQAQGSGPYKDAF